MIVKFLASSKAKGAGAVDYVLSEKKHVGSPPKILRGDEELTRAIIKNNEFKQKATFGVLSFEEENIAEELKHKLMTDFENTLMPNMTQNNYNILWVEHRDKGRLELNFIIPKIELTTKKSFNPFWDKFDRTRLNEWRELQNLKYGFSSPEDLEKKQSVSHDNEQSDRKELTPNQIRNKKIKELNEKILDNLLDFSNRDEVVEYINKAAYKVIPKKGYIAVYFDEKQTKASRLKGAYASEQFRTIEDIRGSIREERKRVKEQKAERTGARREDTIRILQKKLEISIDKKVSQINKLFNLSTNNFADNNFADEASNNISISELLQNEIRNNERLEREAQRAEAEAESRAREAESRAREAEKRAEQNRRDEQIKRAVNRVKSKAIARARAELEAIEVPTHKLERESERERKEFTKRHQIQTLHQRIKNGREAIKAVREQAREEESLLLKIKKESNEREYRAVRERIRGRYEQNIREFKVTVPRKVFTSVKAIRSNNKGLGERLTRATRSIRAVREQSTRNRKASEQARERATRTRERATKESERTSDAREQVTRLRERNKRIKERNARAVKKPNNRAYLSR